MAAKVIRQEDGSVIVVNQEAERTSHSNYPYLIRTKTRGEAEGVAKGRGLSRREWRYMPRNSRINDGLFTTRDKLIGAFTPEEIFTYTGNNVGDTSPDAQNGSPEH